MLQIEEKKVMVNFLEGFKLDMAISIICNRNSYINSDKCRIMVKDAHNTKFVEYCPSSKWLHGGPLIEQFDVSLESYGKISVCKTGSIKCWLAYIGEGDIKKVTSSYGETALQAAMRSIVKSKHGETITDPV